MKVRFAVAPYAGSLSGQALTDCARALETAGFDGIWLSDVPVAPVIDPLLGLALVAGQSRRLRLGANIVPLGRNPFLLAKALAQLDQISSGRLLLSFVTGLNQPGEDDALGLRRPSGGRPTGAGRSSVTGTPRGAILEEMLGLLRAWWSGQSVDHESEAWSYTALAPATRPVQDPLEVWLGGRGPQALDRVGRIADGWLGALVTPAEAEAARERIQASAEQAGREIDPEHFGLSIAYARTEPAPELLAALTARRPELDPLSVVPVGRAGLRALLAEYVAAGLSKFVLRPTTGVEAWSEEAAWLAEAILDLQT